ncbi:MAG: S8 family serine peptidase [Actinomycetota bacterium]|nr:S8 family serine peptidase [Actinomycetota bacterium]
MFVGLQGATQEAITQPVDPARPGSSAAEEPTFRAPDEPRFVPGEILVKPRAGVPEQALEVLNRQNNARVAERLPGIGVSVIDLPADLPVQAAVRRYEGSRGIQYAEPNFLLFPEADPPNDPAYNKLYGLNNTGQTGGTADADIDAPEVWDTTTGTADTVVAVIDEGIDVNHPDLNGNIWTNSGEVPGNNIDDDKNGYVDDVHGWDFYHDDATVYDAADGDKHGTHVAGTIAAEGNNGEGVTGVNWRASIMPLKFLGPDYGSIPGAVKAIDYAVAEGAKISNNSWGCGGSGCYSKTLKAAIDRADGAEHLFVAAAGNDGTDNDATPQYPANYDSPNVISVAATNNQDSLASFSNYGKNSVDLGAPGVGILSTLPGNGYGSYSGTSMATPHVTGVAALLKSQNPTYSDEEMKDQILRYSEPKNSLQGKMATGGRLNAYAALTGQQALDSTRPTITAVKPNAGSKTRDRTPTIGATVSDDRTELTDANIELYLDAKKRTTFTYNEGADRLNYTAPRLSYSKHNVKIVATDGSVNSSVKSWSFTVRR